ncbi:hypothetical protein PUV54_03595 [Hyphococcus flavus]|uniref:Uncharacterized protein n=1 Tax=Hyphococcus flavus TaxID=1866326 RepID=A0AAE9ZCG4_9PROT|nr:hypothetical protein [Hyphococcus flavus]WDI32274.1 hypothetical protein PUV54_03595 [Hyphococcus flavus]
MFAVIAPWISLFSAFVAEIPTTQRKLRNTRTTDRILTEKLRLEQTRSQFLASEEQALIDAAKRDEQVDEIEDFKTRQLLQEQIETLRSEAQRNREEQERFFKELNLMQVTDTKRQEQNSKTQKYLTEVLALFSQIDTLNNQFVEASRNGKAAEVEVILNRIKDLRNRQFTLVRSLRNQLER